MKNTHHWKTLRDYRSYKRIKRGSKTTASRLSRRRARQDLLRALRK